MIKNPQLARKYAKALFEATGGQADLASLDLSPAVRRALVAPSIEHEKLIRLVGEPASPEIRNLLRLLSRRKRHALLPDIAEMYTQISEDARGIARAKVTTAAPVDLQVQDRMLELIRKLSGAKEVKLHLEQNPDLIGGVVIKIGDNMIDGSVRSKLEQFRQRF